MLVGLDTASRRRWCLQCNRNVVPITGVVRPRLRRRENNLLRLGGASTLPPAGWWRGRSRGAGVRRRRAFQSHCTTGASVSATLITDLSHWVSDQHASSVYFNGKAHIQLGWANIFLPCSFFSTSRWYHGRLERKKAEERLWRANRNGTYLVRESERKPGSYSLSFLGMTGINHFRITSIYGQYYIGGRQFSSLRDLIGYYTNCSCLLENEHLRYPLVPEGVSLSLQFL